MVFQEFDASELPQPILEFVPPFVEPRGVEALALRAIRIAARVGGAVAPKRMGELCYSNYFKARVKAKVPAEEQRLLERGSPVTLPWTSPPNALFPYSGQLRLWSWGTGPKVILVHGFGARMSHLALQFVDSLVEAGCSVVAFELPGHATNTSGRCDVFSAAAALQQVIAHTGPIRAILSHSFGVCASALAVGRGVRCERFVGIGSLAWLNPLAPHFCDVLRLSPEVRKHMLACVDKAFSPDGLPPLATDRQLAALDCPALIIHDREDRLCHWSGAVAIHRACLNSTLRLTSGLGHFGILRNEVVKREVVDFIRPQAVAKA